MSKEGFEEYELRDAMGILTGNCQYTNTLTEMNILSCHFINLFHLHAHIIGMKFILKVKVSISYTQNLASCGIHVLQLPVRTDAFLCLSCIPNIIFIGDEYPLLNELKIVLQNCERKSNFGVLLDGISLNS